MPIPASFASAADLAPLPVFLDQLYRDPEEQNRIIRHELMIFCCTVKWFLLLSIFVGSFFFVMWAIFHPNFPLMMVTSAALSSFTINTTAVGECNVTLVLTNPNRHLTTVYDHMEISLLYDSQKVLLSKLPQPLIVQPKRTQITLHTSHNFSGAHLGSSVVSAMKDDLDRGSLGLGINISAVLKYRNGTWKSKPRYMRAYCGGVSFGFTSINKPGIFLNPYQHCEVLERCIFSIQPRKKMVFQLLNMVYMDGMSSDFDYSFTKEMASKCVMGRSNNVMLRLATAKSDIYFKS